MTRSSDTLGVEPEPEPEDGPGGADEVARAARHDDVAEAGPRGNGDGTPARGRRRHRRAVGGTVPPGPEPHVVERSPDDLDVAWGDRPSGSDDERFLREVPPHW